MMRAGSRAGGQGQETRHLDKSREYLGHLPEGLMSAGEVQKGYS